MKKSILLVGAALGAGALIAFAQDSGGTPPPGGRPGGPGGPGGRPPSPLFAALDTNKDGKLDATEIANASTSLKTLDKNNDGEITQDEIRGPRPGGGRGGPGGPGGGSGPRPPAQPQQ